MATPAYSGYTRGSSPHAIMAPAAWKGGDGNTRRAKEEIDLILSWPEPIGADADDEEKDSELLISQDEMLMIGETNQLIHEAANSMSGRKKFVEFQDWVRAEVKEKGYVELPDELLRDREKAREVMEEELSDMLERIEFSGDESCFGNYDGVHDGQENPKRRRKLL